MNLKRALIAVGVLVLLVGALPFARVLARYQDDKAFEKSTEAATQASEPGGAVAALEAYVREHPRGQHVVEARTRLSEARAAMRRANQRVAFEQAIKNVLKNESFAESRKQLLARLAREGDGVDLLLQLAFLTFGTELDNFTTTALERSNRYVARALKLDPQNQIAPRLRAANQRQYESVVKNNLPNGPAILSDKTGAILITIPGEGLVPLSQIREARLQYVVDVSGEN
ncbi:MAG: hypothetical protein Q7T82_08545 [Armatimonadota bacterium]|nr:hypothetical protein [Armatimonadota bacterium]